MSLPDPPPSGKYRHLWLIIPFGLTGLLVAGWSATWVWAKGEAVRRLDAAQVSWDAAGYHLTWKDRQVGGYPFRLDVTLIDPAVREPSGWALEAPRIEGEANLMSPTQWIIAAPAGVTFTRPDGGPVAVSGEVIRASLGHLQNHPPNFDVEGVKLVFTPAPDAQPFALKSAERAEFHLRQGPDDEGGVFLMLAGGKARTGGLLSRLAGDRPIAMQWNSTLSKVSAFAGPNWPQAVHHWSAAGGKLTVRNAGISAGDPIVGVTSGTVGVAADGRADGTLAVTVAHPDRLFEALAAEALIDAEAAKAAEVDVSFQDGRTRFGPVSPLPAPKVYDRR